MYAAHRLGRVLPALKFLLDHPVKVKDTVITAKAKRREIILASGCFIAACIVNLYAVVKFHRPWTELFSQIGYVVIIAAVFYAVIWAARLAAMLLQLIFCRSK